MKARKVANSITVRRTIELDVEFECDVTPGEPDHYDRSIGGPGGWSPGSGPEVEIISVSTEKGALLNILDEIDARTLESVKDDAINRAAEDAAEGPDPDDERDRRRDDEWDRRHGY